MNGREAIAPWLEPGETLIWTEAADADAMISDFAPEVAWGLFFTVFAVIALVALLRQRGADMPPEERRNTCAGVAFSSIFALVGGVILYVAGTQVLSASTTTYGLTDRRLIVVCAFPFQTQHSYTPEAFTRMLAWEDEPRLEFAYSGPQKGPDYDARLYVRDPRAWEARIRQTFGIEQEPDIPD